MHEKISYNELLPTFGDHRPLWPKFGEYRYFNCIFPLLAALIANFIRFVPKERWLHNIEHGAVIMLYDPCAINFEVEKLKKIVKSCIKKHIITPTTFLSQERVSFFYSHREAYF